MQCCIVCEATYQHAAEQMMQLQILPLQACKDHLDSAGVIAPTRTTLLMEEPC